MLLACSENNWDDFVRFILLDAFQPCSSSIFGVGSQLLGCGDRHKYFTGIRNHDSRYTCDTNMCFGWGSMLTSAFHGLRMFILPREMNNRYRQTSHIH